MEPSARPPGDAEDPDLGFTYRVRKNGEVEIRHRGRVAATLSGGPQPVVEGCAAAATHDANAYDAIIVGAGPGGSAIAALLARAGLRVLLVDKNAAAGGKMMAVHRDGFDYELFPINAVPARNSLFEQLVHDLELGAEVEAIYPDPVGRFYFELPGGEIRTMTLPAGQPSPFGFRRLLTSPMNVFITYSSVSTLADFRDMAAGRFPDHSYVYLGTTSLYPGLAPAGKQLVYACMSCLGDPQTDIAPYLAQVKKIVVKMQPDILAHIEREETFGPATISHIGRDSVLPGRGGEDYGVMLSVGQYGDPRLSGETPIAGLYYVGGDAGGFGLGTHQAVDSAVNVSQLVLAYHDDMVRFLEEQPG